MLRNTIIGYPLSHSLSPKLHNQLYRECHIDTDFIFNKDIVSPDFLNSFMKDYKTDDTALGIAVTIPHKEKIISYLETVDETALKIGAVNTVVKIDNHITGYNTDWIGIYEPLKNLESKTKVAILGGGGAARAVLFACQKLGFESIVFLRNVQKGNQLYMDFGCEVSDWKHIPTMLKSFGLIVNTTPIGMYPDIYTNPISNYIFGNHQIVMDLIYNPHITQLLMQAQNDGAQIITGSEMFIFQAQEQFKLFTNTKPNISTIRKIFNSIAG